MKNSKIYLRGFIIILYFSFILLGTNIISIEQDNKDNGNVLSSLTISSSLKSEWYRTWGGSSNDRGHGLVEDSSDNVYIVGYTYSFGAGWTDMVLVKYDENGVQQWNRQWGGAEGDVCTGAAIDLSGNVYLAGYTDSFGAGGSDMALVKYDKDGVQQWNRTWGGVNYQVGRDVVLDSSGNIYLAGTGVAGMKLVKYDGNGVQQWNRTWGGAGDDYGRGVAVDLSDNVYLTGYTNSLGAGNYDLVLVKYDGNGVQQWNRTWGGVNGEVSQGTAVDSSGNVYIVGYTNGFGAGYEDIVLVKYNTNGIQQWNRTWGGPEWDYGYGVTVNSSGNVYLTGSFEDYMVLVEYDGNGVQQGNWTWGSSYTDVGQEVLVDLPDNIYIVGTTNSYGEGEDDMVLVKFVPDIPDNDSTSSPSIPSYNLYIIIGMLSISCLFLVKKVIHKRSN